MQKPELQLQWQGECSLTIYWSKAYTPSSNCTGAGFPRGIENLQEEFRNCMQAAITTSKLCTQNTYNLQPSLNSAFIWSCNKLKQALKLQTHTSCSNCNKLWSSTYIQVAITSTSSEAPNTYKLQWLQQALKLQTHTSCNNPYKPQAPMMRKLLWIKQSCHITVCYK